MSRGKRKEIKEEKVKKVAPRIIKQPTNEEFRLTDKEKSLLQDLYDWGERSKKTPWVLGKPLGCRS